jgi:hypothetical protein
MELGSNVRGLDNENLKDMSLKELESKLDQASIAAVSRPQVLDILMSWLNQQIKQETITQQESLLQGFVILLRMHHHAKFEPFNLKEINQVFNGWLEKDAIKNPVYMRRYLITQQDVHRLFAQGETHAHTSSSLSPLGQERGQQRADSSALTCEQGNQDAMTKQTTNEQQSKGHDKTASGTQHPTSPTNPEVIVIDDDDDEPNKLYDSMTMVVAASQELKVLHSQNVDIHETTDTRETIVINSSPNTNMSQTPTRKNRHGRKHKLFSDSLDFSDPPPGGYICKRCDKPGRLTLTGSASLLTVD